MLEKFLIICTILSLAQAQAQCNDYWKYIKGNGNDGIQGVITLPPQGVTEHKIKIMLSVGSKLASVSDNFFYYVKFEEFMGYFNRK